MRKIRLVRKSSACPESYEAYEGEVHVAYLKLRYGHFIVSCPDYGGDIIYSANPRGDGIFEDEAERALHLQRAVNAIVSHLDRNLESKLAEYEVEPG